MISYLDVSREFSETSAVGFYMRNAIAEPLASVGITAPTFQIEGVGKDQDGYTYFNVKVVTTPETEHLHVTIISALQKAAAELFLHHGLTCVITPSTKEDN